MKTRLRTLFMLITLLSGAFVGSVSAQGRGSLSALSSAEVISMLESAPTIKTESAPSAVIVDGEDLIGKVYGLRSHTDGRDKILEAVHNITSLSPDNDEGAYWLDSDNGYRLEYNGMSPEVMAMARFNDDKVADFGYFFLFPYNDTDKEDATTSQADFCGTLLQELQDMGLHLGSNVMTEDLFEVVGDDNGNMVNARLIDDNGDDGSGRYILFLTVEPEDL